jgi:hypothetical protein
VSLDAHVLYSSQKSPHALALSAVASAPISAVHERAVRGVDGLIAGGVD